MPDLEFDGTSVDLGDGLVVRAAGYAGSARRVDTAAGPGLRAAGGTSEALQAAMDRAEMETVYVVEVEAAPLDFAADANRAVGGQVGAIQLDVPQPPQDYEQAVLSVDEHGVTTWSFAPEGERTPAARGGGAARTFTIPRTAGAPPEPGVAADRSIVGEIGKQILKVVAFPIGRVVGNVVNGFLGQWETEHHRYGIRDFGPAAYHQPPVYFDGDVNRWQALAKDRTLLFVHGTNSRAEGAFKALAENRMGSLRELYGDRIIAFDHLTITEDPFQNVDWLINTIPAGQSLELDVICHSRGGLVSRALAQRTAVLPGGRSVVVKRLAFVGATNNGTILADAAHWNDYINILSTVLNTLGIAVGETVDLVLSFVRQIAVAGYTQIPGLYAMVPGGPFLKQLGGWPRGETQYLAIASNYEPQDRQLGSYFNDYVKDLIFEGKENDAMVRVDSVVGTTVAGEWGETADKLVRPGAAGIEHAFYFGDNDVADELVTWLRAGLAVPV